MQVTIKHVPYSQNSWEYWEAIGGVLEFHYEDTGWTAAFVRPEPIQYSHWRIRLPETPAPIETVTAIPTPRSDALLGKYDNSEGADLCRDLERENAKLREENNHLVETIREARDQRDTYASECYNKFLRVTELEKHVIRKFCAEAERRAIAKRGVQNMSAINILSEQIKLEIEMEKPDFKL